MVVRRGGGGGYFGSTGASSGDVTFATGDEILFGDGDTKITESVDDTLDFYAGAQRLRIDGNVRLYTNIQGISDGAYSCGTESRKWLNGAYAGYISFAETSTPGTPADGIGRLYMKDAGAGKTGLYVIFPDGVEQQIKVEP